MLDHLLQGLILAACPFSATNATTMPMIGGYSHVDKTKATFIRLPVKQTEKVKGWDGNRNLLLGTRVK